MLTRATDVRFPSIEMLLMIEQETWNHLDGIFMPPWEGLAIF